MKYHKKYGWVLGIQFRAANCHSRTAYLFCSPVLECSVGSQSIDLGLLLIARGAFVTDGTFNRDNKINI